MKSNKEIDIVGKVPSSLTIVGLSLIAIALVGIIVTTYLLPYERKMTGTAMLSDLTPSNDSIKGVLLLELQEELPNHLMHSSGIPIQLRADERVINATLLSITQAKGTNSYRANCQIAPTTSPPPASPKNYTPYSSPIDPQSNTHDVRAPTEKGPRQRSVLNRHRSRAKPEVYRRPPHPTTLTEGSDKSYL